MVEGTSQPTSRNRSRRPVALVAVVALGAVLVAGLGLVVARPWVSQPSCPPIAEHPEWTVARRWDEALLDAIRRALPAPTVHARNLFHTSVAMWDAWAAYDSTAMGYLVNEKHTADNVAAARDEAISYAAYRVLNERYIKSTGGDVSLSEFADLMDALCYPVNVTTTDGDSPAAVGNRIAAAIIAYGKLDGSNEDGGYAATDYRPVNPPLKVAGSGTTMTDPNRWQPLQIEHMISQNGIPVTNGVQQAVGPALGPRQGFRPAARLGHGHADRSGAAAPRLGDPASDQAFKDQAVQVIRDSSMLDPTTDADRHLARVAGRQLAGRQRRPRSRGQPRDRPALPAGPGAPGRLRPDHGRVLGGRTQSETPPGHWNVLANLVSDELSPDLRIAGKGEPVDRLQWDVKLYLAVNGAVHDAAIAAWGLKGYYDSSRPISMIRYMGGLGQSSDSSLPSYDPEGLPLVPGLVELITPETTAPGQRHAALKGHEGEIAIRAWAGNPADPTTEVGGVAWIRAVDWVPYQLPTFVTPSFPGYISGHSTFSRAAAEVLTGFTGSEYFPGG